MFRKRLLFTIAVLLVVLGIAPALSASSRASRLGGEIQLSPPGDGDRYRPAVAYSYDHGEYLVVWHNTWPGGGRDIYARRVSWSGAVLSWFCVATGFAPGGDGKDRLQPAVAYNAANDEYLVVWMKEVSADVYEIWGRIVAWNGSYMGSEFQIITWPNRTFWTPKVAWSSYRNRYLVVWSAFDATTFLATDVAHAVLTASGTKIYGTIISSAYEPHQADVTYNVAADEFLVVWRRMWAPADGDIMAARVSALSGTVVTPPGVFEVNISTQDQLLPAVATNQQNRYVVVWQHAYPGPCCDWDIRGQELAVDGSKVGGWFSLADSTSDETSPAVAARPGTDSDYLFIWQYSPPSGEEILAAHWRIGVSIDYLQVAAAPFLWDHESPAVAWGQGGSLIVYEGDSQGDPTVYRHIYGRLWWPEAIYLPLVLRNY